MSKLDGIHSMTGYSETGDALTDAILKLFHDEAQKRPNGLIDSYEVEKALLLHLVQLLRSTPAHYKDKRVNEVCKSIRELSYLPFKDGEVISTPSTGTTQ